MNEAETRAEHIDPALQAAGWGVVEKRPLGRADIEFTVKADGSVLGTLTVSNGSLVWFPKVTTYGCKMGGME